MVSTILPTILKIGKVTVGCVVLSITQTEVPRLFHRILTSLSELNFSPTSERICLEPEADINLYSPPMESNSDNTIELRISLSSNLEQSVKVTISITENDYVQAFENLKKISTILLHQHVKPDGEEPVLELVYMPEKGYAKEGTFSCLDDADDFGGMMEDHPSGEGVRIIIINPEDPTETEVDLSRDTSSVLENILGTEDFIENSNSATPTELISTDQANLAFKPVSESTPADEGDQEASKYQKKVSKMLEKLRNGSGKREKKAVRQRVQLLEAEVTRLQDKLKREKTNSETLMTENQVLNLREKKTTAKLVKIFKDKAVTNTALKMQKKQEQARSKKREKAKLERQKRDKELADQRELDRIRMKNLQDQVRDLQQKEKDFEKEANALQQKISKGLKDRESLVRDLLKVKEKIVFYEAEQKDIEKLEKRKDELEAQLVDLTQKQEYLLQKQDTLLDEGKKERELREKLEVELKNLEREKIKKEQLAKQIKKTLIAVQTNNLAEVKRLCREIEAESLRTALFEKTCDYGKTILHEAAILQESDVLRELVNWIQVQKIFESEALMSEEEKMVTDDDGLTLLHHAALSGSKPCIEFLLTKLAIPVNSRTNDGSTALHCAVLGDHFSCIQYLCEQASADVNSVNKEHDTCLQVAAMEGLRLVAEYLCERCDVGLAMRCAVEKEDFDVVWSITEIVESSRFDVNQWLKRGNTLLHFAVSNVNHDEIVERVEYLIRKFPNIQNVRNDDGFTPFDIASKSKKVPQASLLCLYKLPGASFVDFNTRFRDGKTLLIIAVNAMKDADVYELLQNQDIDVNIADDMGYTAAHYAVQNEQIELIKLLCQRGSIPSGSEKDGTFEETPLSIALDKGFKDIAILLLSQSNINVDFRDRSGKGVFDIIRRLIIDIHTNNKASPLTAKDEEVYKKMLMNLTESTTSQSGVPETLRMLLERQESFLDFLELTVNKTSISKELRNAVSATLNVVLIGVQRYAAHDELRYVFFKSDVYKSLVRVFLEEKETGDMAAILELIYIGFQANNSCGQTEQEFVKEALYHIDQAKKMTFVRNMLENLNDLDDADVQKFVQVKFEELGNLEDKEAMIQIDQDLNCLEKTNALERINEATQRQIKHIFTIKDTAEEPHYGNIKEIERLMNSLHEMNDLDKNSTYLLLKGKVKELALMNENSELDESTLIAANIWQIYFDERSHCCSALRSCFKCFGYHSANCMGMTKMYHKCIVRGYFSLFPCLVKIAVHISDMLSDMTVGVEIIYKFSKRLGYFILGLALFTLLHENVRSIHRQYETEQELLRVKLGKSQIEEEDWDKGSDLYHHKGNWLLRWIWPYRVGSPKGIFKPLLFNLLSMFLMRPAVDRLVVLTHPPSSLRSIYHQVAKERSLNQHYMILEQIPELLIQFYVFQIFFNNIFTQPCLNLDCTEGTTFNYSSNYFECSNDFIGRLLKFDMCESLSYWLLIFSMTVPFFRIPRGLVSLEDMFRKLDPFTPKMSSVSSTLLYTAYIMMVPSRLFLYAAVMHAVPEVLYVATYVAFLTVMWFLFNVFWLLTQEDAEVSRKYLGQSPVRKRNYLSRYCYVLLFSFRDIWVISLRDPGAYINSSSKVSYKSLRSWVKVMAISFYYFLEGVVGSVIIQDFYPCGRYSHIFKYQGWILLALCITSSSILIIQSYSLQPRLRKVLWKKIAAKSAVVFSFAVSLTLVAVLMFLTRTFMNRKKIVIFSLTIASPFVGIAVVFILVTMSMRLCGEAKNKIEADQIENSGSEGSCLICCCKGSADYIAVDGDDSGLKIV
ncbi:hypothetical protein ACHWQZ_G001794 [Mnemiopsis leidyi]